MVRYGINSIELDIYAHLHGVAGQKNGTDGNHPDDGDSGNSIGGNDVNYQYQGSYAQRLTSAIPVHFLIHQHPTVFTAILPEPSITLSMIWHWFSSLAPLPMRWPQLIPRT